MREMQVALRVVYKDLASRDVSRVIAETTRQSEQAARAQQQSAAATAQAQRQASDHTSRALTVTTKQTEDAARAQQQSAAASAQAQRQASDQTSRALTVTTKQAVDSARTQQQSITAVGNTSVRVYDQSRRASVLRAQQEAQSSKQVSSSILRDVDRLHQARERLGVRSERAIQREILQTAVAYKRLEDSGRLSGRELARAAEAAQAKVRGLRQEMQHLKTPGELGRGVAAIGGGILAGAMMAKRPLSEVMTHERQVAFISNTAYAGEDAAGRAKGQHAITEHISRAVQYGGGKREDAADALNDLLGSSGLSRDDSYAMLPTVQKMALASGRTPREIVPLVGAANANGIPVAQMPDALGKMLYAGETGGYGIENMMSNLPGVLTAQRDNFGMSGMKGLEMALANLQGITAATSMPQESAQSYTALLTTLKNPGVAQSVGKKLSIGGKGVDLNGTLAKGALQGVDPLETFSALIDKSLESNKAYKQLKSRLAKGGGTDVDKEQMATLLEQTVLRDVGVGRKPMLALSGYMAQRESIRGMRSDYAGRGVSAIDTSGSVMLSTASEKLNLAGQAVADARQRALEPLTTTLGDVAAKLSKYAEAYPGLTTLLVGAGDGIKVMTAAALAFGGVKMLTGAGVGAGLGAAATGAGSGVVRLVGTGVSKLAPASVFGKGALARSSPMVSLALGGYNATQVAGSDLPDNEKNAAYTKIAGSTGGGFAGAMIGAKSMSWLGPYGVAAGAVGGGVLGSFGGDWLGEKLGRSWFGSDEGPRAETARAPTIATGGYDPAALQQAMIAKLREPQKMDIKITVDNGAIVAAVQDASARDARRY